DAAAEARLSLVPDPFLAGIVGRAAFRVELPPDAAAIRAAQRRPAFLYAKVPTGDVATVQALERLGFGVVDTNVTFERPRGGFERFISKGPRRPPPFVRFALEKDRTAVVELARRSFSFSRFHLDPAIPKQVADASR